LIAISRLKNAAMLLTQKRGFCVLAPTVITIMTIVFVCLSAAVVRASGTDRGYKVLFVVFAFLIVLKTFRDDLFAVFG
jgi:hypothetical protein